MKDRKIETLLPKVVFYFLVLFIGMGLGYAWRMHHERLQERKHGLLVAPSEDVTWGIQEIRTDNITTVLQQRYTARDKDGNLVLLIKSPPMEVWVGEWR